MTDKVIKQLLEELTKIKIGVSKIDGIGKDIARIDKSLDSINKALDEHSGMIKENTRILKILWDQTDEVTKDLDKIKDGVEFLKDRDKDNIKKLNKRLTEVEGRIGIVPPPEFTVA